MGIVGTPGEAVEAKSTSGTVFGEGNWGCGRGGVCGIFRLEPVAERRPSHAGRVARVI